MNEIFKPSTRGIESLIKPERRIQPIVQITTNILDEDETRSIIEATLELLSARLSKTLGPFGGTTIIQDRMLNHNMCKDGYTVLKNIMIKEDAPRTVLDIVQKISRNLVRKVGDGSTSSIIIANMLYKELNKIMVTEKLPPKIVLDVLNLISENLTNKILVKSTPIQGADLSALANIASISTNNDKETGALIQGVFEKVGKYGFIHVEKSKTGNTYVDDTNGFEIHRGYINAKMATEVDEKTAILKNPAIFMTDSFVGEEDIDILSEVIGSICLQAGGPLVILCKGTDTSFDTFIHMNMTKNPNLPLLVVDISTQSKTAKERFDDLAINLGCTPLRRSEGEEYPATAQELLMRLGTCSKVVATENFTRFIEGGGDKDLIDRRLEKIKLLLDEEYTKEGAIDNEETIYELRKRMSLLQNTMATLYVGGTTEQEKETKKYLVEDAVFACKSALEYGYILGGNLIIPYILNNDKEEIINIIKNSLRVNEVIIRRIVDAVETSFKYSFKCVLGNAQMSDDDINNVVTHAINNYSIYNLRTEEFESFNETTVINSAETDIEIMRSAFSIIGLLVTSNQLIKVNFKDIQ